MKCTLDGTDYKEFEVLLNNQPVGVISWTRDGDVSKGCWYTTASDGDPRYFQTQTEVIEFLRSNLWQPTIKRLGSYLVEAGLLTPEQLNLALADQAESGTRLGEVLAEKGWIKQQTIDYLMEKVILPERS
ncbi:MAG TPA: hypothetical protein V6D03_12285, partial [Candidatus Caenarcaniphilales bacterium]